MVVVKEHLVKDEVLVDVVCKQIKHVGMGRLPISIWRKSDFVFAETDGVNMQMGPNATCSDFFNLYFTKEFWELLVTETNRFAV